MKILAIETSCDDTCIAVIKSQISNLKSQKFGGFKILANIVSSQVKLHSKYGGVYPTLAKREHQRNLVPVLIQALRQSKLLKISKSKFLISKQTLNSKFQIVNSILEREPELSKKTLSFLKKYQKPKIDAIAITIGPGLEPCLWVGVNFAKSLAYFWDLPIIPVNHIEAHIIANWLSPVSSKSKIKNQKSKIYNAFPAVCLVVSGGHTQLILMGGIGKYKVIGETRDDAAGECFDKVARILGLGYPGGPAIAAEAAKLKTINYKLKTKLPRPMMYQNNYDFSFSGLKTAALYLVRQLTINNKQLTIKQKREICAETQQAIIDVLIRKTLKAAKDFKAKSIILGGGVAANNELRKQFQSAVSHQPLAISFFVPPKNLCTDNAAMIGATGYHHWLKGKTKNWGKIEAEANLRIK